MSGESSCGKVGCELVFPPGVVFGQVYLELLIWWMFPLLHTYSDSSGWRNPCIACTSYVYHGTVMFPWPSWQVTVVIQSMAAPPHITEWPFEKSHTVPSITLWIHKRISVLYRIWVILGDKGRFMVNSVYPVWPDRSPNHKFTTLILLLMGKLDGVCEVFLVYSLLPAESCIMEVDYLEQLLVAGCSNMQCSVLRCDSVGIN